MKLSLSFVLFLSTMLFVNSCSTTQRAPAISESMHSVLSLVYTNDIEGSVDTCGCGIDPGGGIVRRLNWYRASRLSPDDTLYLNSGNSLFSSSPFLDYEVEYMKYGATAIVSSMVEMELSAYTPGEQDFKLGLDFFTEVTEGLPIVVTNSETELFKESIIVEKGINTIGILGIVDPQLFEDELKNKLQLKDPLRELRSAVRRLRRNVDIVVCNVHADEKLLSSILDIRGIDIVVSSGISEELTRPKLRNNSIVLRTFKGGDSIGLLSYEHRPRGKKVDLEYNNYVKSQLAALEIARYNVHEESLLRELEKEVSRLKREEVSIADSNSLYYNRIDFLGEEYASENEFTPMLEKYKALQFSATPQLEF